MDPDVAFGALLAVRPYKRSGPLGLLVGIAAYFEHMVVPDPENDSKPLGKVWISLTEKATMFCNFEVSGGKRGVWDE